MRILKLLEISASAQADLEHMSEDPFCGTRHSIVMQMEIHIANMNIRTV